MAKKKKKKPAIGSDPFSGHEEIMQNFFSPQPETQDKPEPVREEALEGKIIQDQKPSPPPPPAAPSEPDPPESLPEAKKAEEEANKDNPFMDKAMLSAFREELEENLEQLDVLLVDLENNPDDAKLINEVFRLVHTTKGSAGFMNFKNLKDLCHSMESLLDKARSKKLQLTIPIMDIILGAIDQMKEIAPRIAANGHEEGIDVSDNVAILEALLSSPEEKASAEPKPAPQESVESKTDATPVSAPEPVPQPDVSISSMVDQEIIDDFIQESQEGLDELDADLVTLETNPEDAQLLNKVFRVMHTLKGAAGFMGFNSIQATAHKSEDVLNKIRSGEFVSSPQIVDVLLQALDVIKSLMKNLADSGKESTDTSHVLDRLEAVLSGTGEKIEPKTMHPKTEETAKPKEMGDQKDTSDADKGKPSPQPSQSTQIKQGNLVKQSISTIRVDVERLDNLMNLAGELVLARNRQIQLSREVEPELGGKEELQQELSAAVNQLDFITTELQFAVMKTRMLPVSAVFSKFTRVVRDLSRSLGKEVDLVIEGETTELDKNIIEEIGDPMVHLIRNSVDHGIETPEERLKNGKHRKGVVNLSAYHEGSYVVIEIQDNGKGMDAEKLKDKAVEKGVISPEEAKAMSKTEALNLIFAAGFSTAEKVSDVSGRGVGMDVVRSNIEKLKGIIELDSNLGKGSVVKIKIPLTLAILQTLLCKLGDERYAIPLDSVKETVRVPVSELQTVRGKRVVKLREEVLPLVFLNEILDFETIEKEEICIVVVQHGIQRLGCVVDDTIGQEEVVIKTLDVLKDICENRFFSGGAILGDGVITLILDVSELMRFAHTSGLQEETKPEEDGIKIEDSLKVLLVDDGAPEQYALPINSIKMIENIPFQDIEIVGGRKVVRHEGEVLPIINLSDITKFGIAQPEDFVYLIIVGKNGDSAGLAVNKLRGMRLIDRSEVEDCFSTSGVAFSAVLDNRVTLILKEDAVVQQSREGVHTHGASNTPATKNVRKQKILVVDDSPVARESIRKALVEGLFEVTLAVDGKDALGKISNVDLVVTDLEMPIMNGYELTRSIKSTNHDLPVIMVTSLDGEEDRLEGLKAGVDDYQTKLDVEKLLASVRRHIRKS